MPAEIAVDVSRVAPAVEKNDGLLFAPEDLGQRLPAAGRQKKPPALTAHVYRLADRRRARGALREARDRVEPHQALHRRSGAPLQQKSAVRRQPRLRYRAGVIARLLFLLVGAVRRKRATGANTAERAPTTTGASPRAMRRYSRSLSPAASPL